MMNVHISITSKKPIEIHHFRGALKPIYLTVVLCFVFIYSKPVIAQEDSENILTKQIWLDYNVIYPISESFELFTSTGYKTIFPGAWNKIFINPEVSYKVPKLMLKKWKYSEKLYFGIDIYYAFLTDSTNVFEFTPYQGYSLVWPNRKRLTIKHNFGLQMSYEATMTFKFHGDLWKYGKGFYIPVSIRVWWNLVDATFHNDVARITPGIGYQISPAWKTAFKLGYTYTKNTIGGDFSTDNIIFWFRVYHTLLKKD